METKKYRYIDLKGKEGRDGFKDMRHLKKGDEVEVNVFELGYPEISDFLFALKRTADRIGTAIELTFNEGTTFDGFQTFKLNQQSTSQQQTIERLLEELKKPICFICHNTGRRKLSGSNSIEVDCDNKKCINRKIVIEQAEQLFNTTEQ